MSVHPEINQHIADRNDIFYWQTDRAVEPAEAGRIWADRHRYFSDDEIVRRVNEALSDDKLISLEPLDPDAQTNLGNVNSVRSGRLASGAEVIVRCHPKGIRNGYFHAEAAAAGRAKHAGLPAYDTCAIHDFAGGDDFAFHVIERLSDTAVTKWLAAHPSDESDLLPKIGSMMARLHQTTVQGFGPFDNQLARTGTLCGLHGSQAPALRAGLPFNLRVMQQESVINDAQAARIADLFGDNNPLLAAVIPVLVHNDFADWNLLTDGHEVTGILDWDECVGGDPILDIACWGTFFQPERMAGFLEGYWQVADKPDDYEAKYELYRLRYVLSKMTLRLRRYSWEPSEAIRERIESGRAHLAQSLKYFDL